MSYSMFVEFEKVKNRLEEIEKKNIKVDNRPAMIILERKETGENTHAIVGDVVDSLILLEWLANILSKGLDVPFEELLEVVNQIHKDTDHIMINDIRKNLDKGIKENES